MYVNNIRNRQRGNTGDSERSNRDKDNEGSFGGGSFSFYPDFLKDPVSFDKSDGRSSEGDGLGTVENNIREVLLNENGTQK